MRNKKNNGGRNLLSWVVIVFVLVVVYELFSEVNVASSKIGFSDFLDKLETNQISEVVIRGNTLEGRTVDGQHFSTLAVAYPDIITDLRTHGVKFTVARKDSSMSNLFALLLSWFPVLLLIGVWVYFMRNMQSGGSKAMGFGKSKARLINPHENKVTFADVAGVDEAKEEVQEVVDFLKDPTKFREIGGQIPKGCLLVGSPGTGKTLLARAIAGEAKVPFFSASGSEFVEMFVGVGAGRARDLFEQAKKNSPCIVFIDEIDAVGRHRGAGLGGGNDEREQTLNQILIEMDGFTQNTGVIVIAATNRPDVLDPALLRPGRFDRQIVVPMPDINGREQILKVHAKSVKLAPDVDLRVSARGTPGFSGADLRNLVNEAALIAARSNKQLVTMLDLDEARDKVMMGAERRSMVMTDEDKELTAYHEGGHAVVAHFCRSKGYAPIHKATIIPRGRALGMVQSLPERDKYSQTREELKSHLAVAMGGRVAEEMIFGYDKVTSGAKGDIQMATSTARSMVTQWGMSDKIGPVLVGDDRGEVFLGHTIGHEKKQSDHLAEVIDSEVKALVEEGKTTAEKILKDNIEKLHELAKILLERETLTGEEIGNILEGKSIDAGKKPSSRKKKAETPKSSLPKGGDIADVAEDPQGA